MMWLGAVLWLSACGGRSTPGNHDLGPLPIDHGNIIDHGQLWLDGDPGFCSSLSPCAGDEYCEAFGCSQTGTCQPKPQGCDLMYAPVCGCDGQTYGNRCEAQSKGAIVDYEGECKGSNQQACELLMNSYAKALDQAKQCNPALSIEQCVTLVTVSLPCGCETFINGLDPDGGKWLDKLALEWKMLDCPQFPWPCPGMPCAVANKGYCGPNGRCQDG